VARTLTSPREGRILKSTLTAADYCSRVKAARASHWPPSQPCPRPIAVRASVGGWLKSAAAGVSRAAEAPGASPSAASPSPSRRGPARSRTGWGLTPSAELPDRPPQRPGEAQQADGADHLLRCQPNRRFTPISHAVTRALTSGALHHKLYICRCADRESCVSSPRARCRDCLQNRPLRTALARTRYENDAVLRLRRSRPVAWCNWASDGAG
jgi:hypothetical protein